MAACLFLMVFAIELSVWKFVCICIRFVFCGIRHGRLNLFIFNSYLKFVFYFYFCLRVDASNANQHHLMKTNTEWGILLVVSCFTLLKNDVSKRIFVSPAFSFFWLSFEKNRAVFGLYFCFHREKTLNYSTKHKKNEYLFTLSQWILVLFAQNNTRKIVENFFRLRFLAMHNFHSGEECIVDCCRVVT